MTVQDTAEKKRKSGAARRNKGMTLLEVVLASSLLTILMLLAMTSFVDVVKAVNAQSTITRMDQRANKALREVSDLLKPAILPIFVERTVADYANKRDIFYDIDNRSWGFGGAMGKKWLSNLQAGMDCIAFVVPIDAQGVGDFLDGANHLQIGQLRGDTAYLGATPTGTPGNGTSFVLRTTGEVVNALAAMDPATLASANFEAIESPTRGDWAATANPPGDWPDVTAFMAIRFVPLQSGGSPIVLTEQNIFSNYQNVQGVDVDLDKDGRLNGQFHIGHLQLVYSGGSDFYHVEGSTTKRGEVLQLVQRLTPDVVLRRVAPGDRTPIFRLVDYDFSNLSSSAGDSGMVEQSGRNGQCAVSIKLLMLDNDGISPANRPVTKAYLQSLSARWYETTVTLKNMRR